MKNKITVMGVDYEIITGVEEKDDPQLKERMAYVDMLEKRIVISAFEAENEERSEHLLHKLLRHEVIHAFLYESGLDTQTDWATSEQMVEWWEMKLHSIVGALDESGIRMI